MIKFQPFRVNDKRFTPEATELGRQLAAMVEPHVKFIQTWDNEANRMVVRAEIEGEAALEAAVAKAGFRQDGLGQWFYGAKLETADKPAVPGMHVPTPDVLQPNPIKKPVLQL